MNIINPKILYSIFDTLIGPSHFKHISNQIKKPGKKESAVNKQLFFKLQNVYSPLSKSNFEDF